MPTTQDQLAAALAALLNAENRRTLGPLTADAPLVRELAVALVAALPHLADVLGHKYGAVILRFERGEAVLVEASFSHKTRRVR